MELDSIAQKMRTIATGEGEIDVANVDGYSMRFVASSRSTLGPASRGILGEYDAEVRGPGGMHAEIKVIQAADVMGVRLRFITTTRLPCAVCQEILDRIGIPVYPI
jgi:hypothetical protein